MVVLLCTVNLELLDRGTVSLTARALVQPLLELEHRVAEMLGALETKRRLVSVACIDLGKDYVASLADVTDVDGFLRKPGDLRGIQACLHFGARQTVFRVGGQRTCLVFKAVLNLFDRSLWDLQLNELDATNSSRIQECISHVYNRNEQSRINLSLI